MKKPDIKVYKNNAINYYATTNKVVSTPGLILRVNGINLVNIPYEYKEEILMAILENLYD